MFSLCCIVVVFLFCDFVFKGLGLNWRMVVVMVNKCFEIWFRLVGKDGLEIVVSFVVVLCVEDFV